LIPSANFPRAPQNTPPALDYRCMAALQMTLAHMCITGLDLLGKLEMCSEADKIAMKGWILAQQATGTVVGSNGLN